MIYTAFFQDKKHQARALEDAMDWLIDEASRFGMTGPEAEAKGYAQIFRDSA